MIKGSLDLFIISQMRREEWEEDIMDNYSFWHGKFTHYSHSDFIGQHSHMTNLMAGEARRWITGIVHNNSLGFFNMQMSQDSSLTSLLSGFKFVYSHRGVLILYAEMNLLLDIYLCGGFNIHSQILLRGGAKFPSTQFLAICIILSICIIPIFGHCLTWNRCFLLNKTQQTFA